MGWSAEREDASKMQPVGRKGQSKKDFQLWTTGKKKPQLLNKKFPKKEWKKKPFQPDEDEKGFQGKKARHKAEGLTARPGRSANPV